MINAIDNGDAQDLGRGLAGKPFHGLGKQRQLQVNPTLSGSLTIA